MLTCALLAVIVILEKIGKNSKFNLGNFKN